MCHDTWLMNSPVLRTECIHAIALFIEVRVWEAGHVFIQGKLGAAREPTATRKLHLYNT